MPASYSSQNMHIMIYEKKKTGKKYYILWALVKPAGYKVCCFGAMFVNLKSKISLHNIKHHINVLCNEDSSLCASLQVACYESNYMTHAKLYNKVNNSLPLPEYST